MEISFSKYQGTGNDFILINNMDGLLALSTKEIQLLCDRHFGVGSDGLILLERSDSSAYKMNFYNPDGSQSLCGNGARCTYAFAKDLGVVQGPVEFEAIDGLHKAEERAGEIAIAMKDVSEMEVSDKHYFFDTGSPHYIQYLNDVAAVNLINEAHDIRYGKRFKEEGTNVNFVEEISPGHVKMRTYERGVEDETLSCGTGVTAVGLSQGLRHRHVHQVKVNTAGGSLTVSFDYTNNSFESIWLQGPAAQVFKGQFTL